MTGSTHFPSSPRLATPRLLLAPLQERDVDELLAFFNDPDVARYLLDGASVSREWVEEEVRGSRRRFAEGSAGLWTVRANTDEAAHNDEFGRARADQSLLGIVGFRPFFDPPELQLLYALHRSCWGQRIATEAARAAIDYAFDVMGLDEVRAATDSPNSASIQVLERLGMSRWKTDPGDPWDTLFYRVRSSSWR